MSGLRDGLEQWARARGDEAVARLDSTEPATRDAIGSRRKRRMALIAGSTIAAIAGAAAVAAAQPQPLTIPTVDNPSLDLATFTCGEEWTLEPGQTSRIPGADYYFDEPDGDWQVTSDDDTTTTEVDQFTAGYGTVSWEGELRVKAAVLPRATIVVVKDGLIQGSFEEEFTRNYSFDDPNLRTWTPYPGTCGTAATTMPSGEYAFHLVIQVERVDDGEPVVTFVDPSGATKVTIDGLEAWGESTIEPHPAELREPVGDEYQAFVVPYPEGLGSCTPLHDLRALGAPDENAPQYTVTIPGVQDLTNAMWTGSPVVISNEPVDEWYINDQAMLVADYSGNMAQPAVWWSEDGTTLGTDGGQFDVFGGGCEPIEVLEPIGGAVFLVIDGVDWTSLWGANADSDQTSQGGIQTWVYLGQAS